MRWTRRSIIEEIRTLHSGGEELNYSSAEESHLSLVQAAAWHFGTWKRAVETAGFDYDSVSKYRRWTRERVVAAIREHHKAGRDLSWCVISSAKGDPPLAAAAVRSNIGFETWHDAVEAAGIDYDKIARYRHWTPERVVTEIQALAQKGAPLSSKMVQNNHPPLYNAAKRRFKQWDLALVAAGVNPDKVRQRRSAENLKSHRRRRNSQGELTFDHLEREDTRKRRRQPKKSLFPVPSKPHEEIPATKLAPLPLRRQDKTGKRRASVKKRDLYSVLSKEADKRAKILAQAAKKQGIQPQKSGHARRRELMEQQQLQLELGATPTAE